MIYCFRRGHKVVIRNVRLENGIWLFDEYYADDYSLADYDRPCIKCGRMPTKEGYDACLGYLIGVKFACCGHGVEKGYVKYENILS